LVVKNGSKIRSIRSGEMPCPVSWISSETSPSSARVPRGGFRPTAWLAGIAQQVQQELSELRYVGEHARQPWREGRRHPHAARLELGPDEVEQVAQRVVDVGPLELRLG